MAYSPDLAPSTVVVLATQSPKATVGFTSAGYVASRFFTSQRTNYSVKAQNDYVEYDVALSAGTYTFDLFHEKAADYGIVTVAINGTSVGTIDTYSASFAPTTIGSITAITVAASGRQTVRLTVSSKNASSTNFGIVFNGFAMTRTGA